jgi:hypothetical protein
MNNAGFGVQIRGPANSFWSGAAHSVPAVPVSDVVPWYARRSDFAAYCAGLKRIEQHS